MAMAPPFTLTWSWSGLHSLLPRQHDRGERFVDLEQVEVVDGHAGLGEQLVGGVDGTGQHQHGVDADEALRDDAGAAA